MAKKSLDIANDAKMIRIWPDDKKRWNDLCPWLGMYSGKGMHCTHPDAFAAALKILDEEMARKFHDYPKMF